MDFVNKAKNAVSGSSTSGGSAGAPAEGSAAGGAGNTAPGQDYGDKGLAFIEKKTGHEMGASTNEKITDAARGLYEKSTGNKVDPKYSN